MAAPSFSSLVCLCFIQLLLVLEATTTSNGGFSLDFINRDSPKSPFYDPSNNRFDRLHNAIRRSMLGSSRFSSTDSGRAQSQLIPNSGEYLIKFSIGSPPREVFNVADSASDISWVQCQPCARCNKQITPLFDPKKSSSYQILACNSKHCEKILGRCGQDNVCKYLVSYGDKSFTNGDLAQETFTFNSDSGQPVSFPNVAFGCGLDNGRMHDDRASGKFGLGHGPLSLINQISSFGGKFSYCLASQNTEKTGKINFGSNAVVSGPGVVSTPYFTSDRDSAYYITLESFSIGNRKIPSNVEGDGNLFIYSGTTLTIVPAQLYEGLAKALVELIKAPRVDDPAGLLNLCFSTANGKIEVPTITAHFSGGARLELTKFHTFVETQPGVLCLAMGSTDGIGILGNLAQSDYLVGFDTVNKVVSFKPTDCTQQ